MNWILYADHQVDPIGRSLTDNACSEMLGQHPDRQEGRLPGIPDADQDHALAISPEAVRPSDSLNSLQC